MAGSCSGRATGVGVRDGDPRWRGYRGAVSRAVIAALLAIGGVESNPGPEDDTPSLRWDTYPDISQRNDELQNGAMSLQKFDPDNIASPRAKMHRVGSNTCVQVEIPEPTATGPGGKIARTFSCEVIQYSNPNSSTTTKTTITRGGVSTVVDHVTPPPSPAGGQPLRPITAPPDPGEDTVDGPTSGPQTTTTDRPAPPPTGAPPDQTARVKELEKEVEELEKRLHVEQDENRHLNGKLTDTLEQNRIWTSERLTYVTRITMFEQQVLQLTKDKDNLKKLVDDMSNTTIYIPPPNLVNHVNTCNVENHVLQINDLRQEVAKLTEENRQLNRDLITSHEASDKEATAWEKIYQGLKGENDKCEEKILKLQERLDKEREDHVTDKGELEKAVVELRGHISTLIKTLDDFKLADGSVARNREVEFHEQQIVFLNGKIQEMELQAKRDKEMQKKRYEDMKETANKQQAEIQRYLITIEELRVYEVRSREAGDLEKAVKRERRRAEAVEDKFRRERDAKEKLEEDVAASQQDAERWRKENDALKEKLRVGADSDSDSGAGQKLRKLRQELAAEQEKNDNLIKKLERNRQRFDTKLREWEYIIAKFDDEKDKLVSTLVDKEKELQKLRERQAHLEQALQGDHDKKDRTVVFWKTEYQKMKDASISIENQLKRGKDESVKMKVRISWLEGELKKEKDGSMQLKEQIAWLDGQVKKEKENKVKVDGQLCRLESQLKDSANRLARAEAAAAEERAKAQKNDDELNDFKKSLEMAKTRNELNERNRRLDAAQIEAGRQLKLEHEREITLLTARVNKLKEDLEKMQKTSKEQQLHWHKSMKDLSDEKDKVQNALTLANYQLAELKHKPGKGGNCFR